MEKKLILLPLLILALPFLMATAPQSPEFIDVVNNTDFVYTDSVTTTVDFRVIDIDSPTMLICELNVDSDSGFLNNVTSWSDTFIPNNTITTATLTASSFIVPEQKETETIYFQMFCLSNVSSWNFSEVYAIQYSPLFEYGSDDIAKAIINAFVVLSIAVVTFIVVFMVAIIFVMGWKRIKKDL